MIGGEAGFGEVRALATALGGLRQNTSNLGAFRKGQVVSVEAGTPDTCTITLSGDSTEIAGVFFLDSYIPTVGDVVLLAKQAGSLVILGSVNPTTTVVADIPEIPEPYDDPNQFVYKTADTSRASTTSLTADPHLVLPVEANTFYQVHGAVFFQGSATGDVNLGLFGPSGMNGLWHTHMPSSGSTTETSTVRTTGSVFNGSRAYGLPDDNSINYYTAVLNGLAEIGSTAGNLEFRWAQNTSNSTATVAKKYSYLRLIKIS